MTELQWNQIADTMKQYEHTNNTTLDATKPIVIRLDMRAGGSFVRGLEKPWDIAFTQAMSVTAQKLAEQVHMKDITTITKGVIMHQVNCQNVMGSGVAKALYTKYPQVKKEYHELAKKYDTPQKRTGMLQPVYINDELIICNSYSQMNYGTDKNVRYTNETLLINNLKRLDEFAKSKNLPAYVPEYIGCGLGNGDWNTIKDYIEKQTDIIIVSK